MPETNPLVAALLAAKGGGDSSSLGTDPALIAAGPQMKLAQAMMQQGADSSPVGHWTQALARMANAGAGQYMQSNAVSDLAKAYATQGASAAGAFKGVPGGGTMAKLLSDPRTAPLVLGRVGEAATTLPHQAIQQSNWERTFNKPAFTTIGTDPNTLQPQHGFVQPSTQKVTPYTTPQTAASVAPPVLISTPEEMAKLPAGARFIARDDPKQTIRIKE